MIRKIIPFLIILFLLFTIKNIVNSVQNLHKNTRIVSDLNKELENKKRESEFLKQKLAYVKTDEFVEKQAREKLNLVKKGEYVVIAPETEKSKGEIKEGIPNWEKWWKMFF